MKCQECGKNEVNFHYISNVNGKAAEVHLCSQCASQSGFDFSRVLNMDSFFGGAFPAMQRRASRSAQMFGFNPTSLFIAWPQIEAPSLNSECNGMCGETVNAAPTAEVDGDMQKRREINIMREQMRIAADNDDFEKAALLRDQLKSMENAND